MNVLEKPKLSAAKAAEKAYQDLKNNKIVFIPTTKEPKKNKNYLWLLLLIFFLFPLIFFYPKNYYKTNGSIHIKGKFAKSTKVYFYNKESKEISSATSDKNGNFTIMLKKGYYKIFFKEVYSNPNKSPFSLKLSRDLKDLKIYIP